MTLQQLSYFRTVAQTRSYTTAAQILYVSQSGISYAIQELEREFGVPLLVRGGGKKISLTNYGERLLDYVEHIFDTLSKAKQDLVSMKNNAEKERVRIGYTYFTSFQIINEVFKTFDEDERGRKIALDFEVNQEGADFFSNHLLNGNTDMAFTCIPPQKKLEGVPIAKQELLLLLNQKHPLASKKRVTVADIKDEPIIGYEDDRSTCMSILNKMFEAQNLKPNFTLMLPSKGNFADHLAQVGLSRGIAIVPRMVASARDPSSVAAVFLDDPLSVRDIYLVWVKDKKLSDAADYVRNYVINYCSMHPIMDVEPAP